MTCPTRHRLEHIREVLRRARENAREASDIAHRIVPQPPPPPPHWTETDDKEPTP